ATEIEWSDGGSTRTGARPSAAGPKGFGQVGRSLEVVQIGQDGLARSPQAWQGSAMSLDLFVLTPANAASFDHALAIVMEDAPGTPDKAGELEAYAQEVYNAYGDDDWP